MCRLAVVLDSPFTKKCTECTLTVYHQGHSDHYNYHSTLVYSGNSQVGKINHPTIWDPWQVDIFEREKKEEEQTYSA